MTGGIIGTVLSIVGVMNKFVINLDKRIERMEDWKGWTRWVGVDGMELPKDHWLIHDMISFKNITGGIHGRHHRGKVGCSLSHISLLKHIVDNKIDNVIICEDDAEQINDIPKDLHLADSIVWLGGFFVNIPRNKGALKERQYFPNGLNIVDKKRFRVLCLHAYYIPTWQFAQQILDWLHSKKRWRIFDAMMTDSPFTHYFYFPAIYVQKKLESDIANLNNKRPNEYYEYKVW